MRIMLLICGKDGILRTFNICVFLYECVNRGGWDKSLWRIVFETTSRLSFCACKIGGLWCSLFREGFMYGVFNWI